MTWEKVYRARQAVVAEALVRLSDQCSEKDDREEGTTT
jgi:hypothetical protein